MFLLLALLGCSGDDGETGSPDDTRVTGNDDTAVVCGPLLSVEPADGSSEVYYRDTLLLSFDGDGSTATFTLNDGGADVPVIATWTEGNVQAELAADLSPSTTYTLTVTACDVTTVTTFSTSELGAPLSIDASELVGRTYSFRLSDADITEPAFLDIIAGTYLTVPILIGVTTADEYSIDLIGGLGEETSEGIAQYEGLPTWDFPLADFSEQPYFAASAEIVTIMYGDVPIPIEDFTLEGTFSADGTAIEEGTATGFGDSRYMAELVGREADDYGAVCELAASAGIYCTACTDGEPYCLYIVAEHITAGELDGVTLVEVSE